MNFLVFEPRVWDDVRVQRRVRVPVRFDQVQFSDLIAGDRQLFQALLDLFSQDWPILISRIQQSQAQNDWAQLEQSSHRLKGNLRNFFAHETAALLGEIEENAKQKREFPSQDQIQKIEREIRALEQELQEYLKSY